MINEDEVEQAWLADGFGFGVWEDPPGQRWDDFKHIVDERMMLVSGELALELNGQTVDLKPGELFTVPAGTVHSVVNTGNVANRWLYGYGRLQQRQGNTD